MNRVPEYIDWTQRYMEKLNELVIAGKATMRIAE